ncbi:MAG: branched-chain amino acid ABC transporter permease [Acidimicrobiales bacterium]
MSRSATSESGRPLYPPRPSGIRGYKDPVTIFVVFAVLAILPWVPIFAFTSIFDTGNDFGMGNLAFVFAYAAAAVGFNLLIGFSGTLGLAQAGLFALGAYGTAILSAPAECTDPSCETSVRAAEAGYGWPFLLTIPVVCLAAAVIGIVVGFPAARLRGFFLAIATLALGELIVTIIRLDDEVWSGLKTNGGTGKQVQTFELFGLGRVRSAYFLALIALLITYIGYQILTNRRLGRTLKSVRDIEIATGPLGVSATYYKLVAFGLSAFAAALAGAAWAQNSSFVNPSSFRTRLLVFLLVVLIVGGLGRLWGPLVGAIFFVYVRQELQDTQKLLFLLLGCALMLSVLILPGGLTSLPDRIRESHWWNNLRGRSEPPDDGKYEDNPLAHVDAGSDVGGGASSEIDANPDPLEEIDPGTRVERGHEGGADQ